MNEWMDEWVASAYLTSGIAFGCSVREIFITLTLVVWTSRPTSHPSRIFCWIKYCLFSNRNSFIKTHLWSHIVFGRKNLDSKYNTAANLMRPLFFDNTRFLLEPKFPRAVTKAVKSTLSRAEKKRSEGNARFWVGFGSQYAKTNLNQWITPGRSRSCSARPARITHALDPTPPTPTPTATLTLRER